MAGIGTRRQIKIIRKGNITGDGGFREADAEEVLFSGWAEVSNPSGFRDFISGQTQMGNTKRFRIRNNRVITLDSRTRIKFDGKEYLPSTIEREDEKKFYWIIRATAQDGGRS